MKIKLLINSKEINLDLEKIEKRNKLIEKLISLNEKNSDVFEEQSIDLNNLKKKDLVENIFFLIADRNKNITLTFKKIQNIISNSNEEEEIERIIKNLFDIINMSWSSPKHFFESNIIFYNNSINNQKNIKDNSLLSGHFRNHNLVNINKLENFIEKKIKSSIVPDFNQIPSLYNQFILFINEKEENLSPFIKMQIIHLHNLAISPFYDNNYLLSKIISIWYLIFKAKKDQKWRHFPIQNYLQCLNWNRHQYYQKVKESLETNDYTKFIVFVIDKMINFQKCKIICAKIFKEKRRQRIFIVKHQQKFLFAIVYKNLNEFDWKKFQQKTDWRGSKQFITKNLKKFVDFGFLESEIIRNRKYFYQSRFLKEKVSQYEQQILENIAN